MTLLTAGTRPPGHRVERPCEICWAFDNHPRHIHHWDDGRVTVRHFHCCASAGCPDRSCTDIVPASGQVRGEHLVRFLHSPSFAQVVMAAASRDAPWAATAKAVGFFNHPTLEG